MEEKGGKLAGGGKSPEYAFGVVLGLGAVVQR
jgi:hypothetical protein